MTEQIKVEGKAWKVQAWAGLRQLIPVVATYALAKGYVGEDTLTLILGAAGVILPIVAGQVSTREKAKNLIKLGDSVSDAVATVRR